MTQTIQAWDAFADLPYRGSMPTSWALPPERFTPGTCHRAVADNKRISPASSGIVGTQGNKRISILDVEPAPELHKVVVRSLVSDTEYFISQRDFDHTALDGWLSQNRIVANRGVIWLSAHGRDELLNIFPGDVITCHAMAGGPPMDYKVFSRTKFNVVNWRDTGALEDHDAYWVNLESGGAVRAGELLGELQAPGNRLVIETCIKSIYDSKNPDPAWGRLVVVALPVEK